MSLLKYIKPIVERLPGAGAYYRLLRDSSALNNEPVYRDNLNFYFNGNLSMQEGDFEPSETVIVECLLSSFDVFVNIGANTGYYVCKSLQRGVPTIAFEPNQLNLNILLKNIDANKFTTELQIFPIALSDHAGVLPMYGSSTGASLVKGWAGQKNSYLVPVSTFDKTALPMIENKTCLVLIDIEGAEFNCLKGAKYFLSSSNEHAFLVEICVGEHQPTGTSTNPYLLETFTLMSEYGYTAYTANHALRKIDLSEIANIASSQVDNLGIHNFLFLKNEEVLKKIIFK